MVCTVPVRPFRIDRGRGAGSYAGNLYRLLGHRNSAVKGTGEIRAEIHGRGSPLKVANAIDHMRIREIAGQPECAEQTSVQTGQIFWSKRLSSITAASSRQDKQVRDAAGTHRGTVHPLSRQIPRHLTCRMILLQPNA